MMRLKTLFTRPERLRSLLVLVMLGWALVCLLGGPFMASGPSYFALRWLPQWAWGAVMLAAVIVLTWSRPGHWRALAGALTALLQLWLSLSFLASAVHNHAGLPTGTPVYLVLAWGALMVVRDGAR